MNKIKAIITTAILLGLFPIPLFSMHIMEGFLSIKWSLFWWLIALPFLIIGFRQLSKKLKDNYDLKLFIAMAGAFAFVISSLKMPSVTGSSSHATGLGLGTLIFGPLPMVVMGFIVLLFQALLLAHGGITTLGANTVSMAVFGPLITFLVYRFSIKLKTNGKAAIFLAAMAGNLFTYLITSIQLAVAHPDAQSGVVGAFAKFAGIFMITQIPLAISEGILTVLAVNALIKYASDDMKDMPVYINSYKKDEVIA